MSVSHVATFHRTCSWSNEKTIYKVFDYNNGARLDDANVNSQYMINVPCYRLDDINQMLHNHPYGQCVQVFMSKFDNAVDISTANHRGKQYQYILATPECIEFVKQNSIIGILKGNIKKVPKLHTKTVRIHHRGIWDTMSWKFSKPPMHVDARIANKRELSYIDYALKKNICEV